MARELTAAMIAQLIAQSVRPALFLEIAFASETIYLWAGLGPITPPGPASDPTENTFPYGQAWTGVGWLGNISAVGETTEVAAQNIILTLSGIPSELLADTLGAVRQNSVATVWLGFLDAGNNLIGDPTRCFQGELDVPTITDGGSTSTISITAENPLIDFNRSLNRRFTDCDQQLDYSGDLGFSAVGSLQGLYLGWPAYL